MRNTMKCDYKDFVRVPTRSTLRRRRVPNQCEFSYFTEKYGQRILDIIYKQYLKTRTKTNYSHYIFIYFISKLRQSCVQYLNFQLKKIK